MPTRSALLGTRLVPGVDRVQHARAPAASACAAAGGILERRAEQGEEAVAQELVDDAVVAIDDLDHVGKEVVQQGHRLVGRAHARHGGEAADVEEQHADPAHLARRIGQRAEQPVDHGRRDVLAEQVGDPVARRRGRHRLLELPAQAAGHDAGDEAAPAQHDAAAEMVDQRVAAGTSPNGSIGNSQSGQRQQLHGGDGAGPHRQPEIEPQGRQQDEHEIEHRRPEAEHRCGSM